jgi:transposase InsO family protein
MDPFLQTDPGSLILVVIDAFSKFVKLYPLRRAQARISVRRVVEDFHRVVPIKVILSDHGTQFQSRLWQNTLRQWGITPTMSYSPSSV